MAKTRLMEKKNSNDDGNNKNGKLIKSKKVNQKMPINKNIVNTTIQLSCKVVLEKLSSKEIAKMTGNKGNRNKSESKSTEKDNAYHYELRKRKTDLIKTSISTDSTKDQYLNSKIRNISNTINSIKEKKQLKLKEYAIMKRKEVNSIEKTENNNNTTQKRSKIKDNQMLFKKTRQQKNTK